MALAPEEACRLSREAQVRLLDLPRWRAAREVLLYVAFRREVQTTLLLEDAWARKIKVLLPRCRKGEPGALDLVAVDSAAVLHCGAFGISEPDPGRCPAEASCAVDIAVLPGLAFDRQGRRLGYGGGYYDRLLHTGGLHTALVVGLAYPFQVLPALPSESWDQPVGGICTAQELIWT